MILSQSEFNAIVYMPNKVTYTKTLAFVLVSLWTHTLSNTFLNLHKLLIRSNFRLCNGSNFKCQLIILCQLTVTMQCQCLVGGGWWGGIIMITTGDGTSCIHHQTCLSLALYMILCFQEYPINSVRYI